MSKDDSEDDKRNGISKRRLSQRNELKGHDDSTAVEEERDQRAGQSFTELARNSTRLPEIRQSRLPLSMTEILHSSPRDYKTTLPQIPLGKVQLISNSNGGKESRSKASERRRRREKKALLPRIRCASPTVVTKPNDYTAKQVSWKKKLHRRPKNRLLTSEGRDNATPDFRLPALKEIRHIHPT